MTILQKLDNRISELKKREDLLVTDLDTLRRTIYELEKIRREVTDEEVPEGSEEGFSMQIEEPRQKPRTWENPLSSNPERSSSYIQHTYLSTNINTKMEKVVIDYLAAHSPARTSDITKWLPSDMWDKLYYVVRRMEKEGKIYAEPEILKNGKPRKRDHLYRLSPKIN